MINWKHKYRCFLNYIFRYYLTEDHKYGVLHQDHFTDMFNGDMDGTNNTSETINRGLKKFSNHGKKTLISVFRTIYNFKADCNKKMLHKVKNMRKRNAKTTAKHDSIMQHLREFGSLHPE